MNFTKLALIILLIGTTNSFVFFLLQLGARRIHTVRVRGGNKKYRALRLDQGNFSWGSEGEFQCDC